MQKLVTELDLQQYKKDYKPRKVLKCVWCINEIGPMVMQDFTVAKLYIATLT